MSDFWSQIGEKLGEASQVAQDVAAPGIGPNPRQSQRPDIAPADLAQLGPQPLPGPTGGQAFMAQLRLSPHRRGTPEWDEWILRLPQRPGDPAYNVVLARNQDAARRRIQLRAQAETGEGPLQARRGQRGASRFPTFGPFPQVASETPKPAPSKREERRDPDQGVLREYPDPLTGRTEAAPVVTVVGPDGQPLPDEMVMTGAGTIAPLPVELAAGVETQGTLTQLASGEYVFMGDMTRYEVTPGGGANPDESSKFDPYATTAFMSVDNAVQMPFYWSPEQVAYAQEAFGLDVTGLVDQKLVGEWEKLIATAAGFTAAGRMVDPITLLDMTWDATQAALAASGGGGGGGGAGYNRSEVKLFLNRVMLEEVGREATDEEQAAFYSAFVGAGDVDPEQFAIDWIRGAAGSEAANFQVATDYYQAMLAILGANTQAEEPVTA